MNSVQAAAHPNIALVKYWGKQPTEGNRPAVPSLSITLNTLVASTSVSESTEDSFELDGKALEASAPENKISRFLSFMRSHHSVPPLRIVSENNFPTAAGLASSAAGFAALVTAIDALCEFGLTSQQLSQLARVGSASAARSLFGGFVGLQQPDFAAKPIAPIDHWPLQVVIAITDTQQKSVSSTEGMQISAATSPYYSQWLESAHVDYTQAIDAIENRDFTALTTVAEHSCRKMHAVMHTSQPPLLYWNAATVACMHRVTEMREEGREVFYTIDAGPQVKAVCTSVHADAVESALTDVPGVVQVQRVGLGGAPWISH